MQAQTAWPWSPHTHTHTHSTPDSLHCTSQPSLLASSHAVIFSSIPSTPSAAIHHICRPLRKDRSPSVRLIREGQDRSFLLPSPPHPRTILSDLANTSCPPSCRWLLLSSRNRRSRPSASTQQTATARMQPACCALDDSSRCSMPIPSVSSASWDRPSRLPTAHVVTRSDERAYCGYSHHHKAGEMVVRATPSNSRISRLPKPFGLLCRSPLLVGLYSHENAPPHPPPP